MTQHGGQKKRVLFRLRVVGWVAVAVLPFLAGHHLPAALWQEQSGTRPAQASSEETPRVSVGEISGTPGEGLMVPLYFTPGAGSPLRSLTVEIDYVSNNLKFEGASMGIAAEKVGAAVAATLVEGKADEKGVTRSQLKVTTALVDTNPDGGIPEGLLAYLSFQVSTDAKPSAIRLNTTVVSAEDLEGRKVATVSAQPGLIVVETFEPKVACFFFSH